jgi:hypothetical protein
MCSQSSGSLLRLQVVADADPTALLRVLERFQNLNIVPRRITAEFGTNNILHVAVDVFGVPEARLALIVNKVRQATSIINAHWCEI